MLAKLASIRGRFRMVWFEWLLTVPVVIGLFYGRIHLLLYGYRNPPYFLVASDTFLEDRPPDRRTAIPRTFALCAGRIIVTENTIGIGIVVRPLMLHLMLITLSVVTIRDVWADARVNGWQSPLPWRRKLEPAS